MNDDQGVVSTVAIEIAGEFTNVGNIHARIGNWCVDIRAATLTEQGAERLSLGEHRIAGPGPAQYLVNPHRQPAVESRLASASSIVDSRCSNCSRTVNISAAESTSRI